MQGIRMFSDEQDEKILCAGFDRGAIEKLANELGLRPKQIRSRRDRILFRRKLKADGKAPVRNRNKPRGRYDKSVYASAETQRVKARLVKQDAEFQRAMIRAIERGLERAPVIQGVG